MPTKPVSLVRGGVHEGLTELGDLRGDDRHGGRKWDEMKLRSMRRVEGGACRG
jgi:hypothetical protein